MDQAVFPNTRKYPKYRYILLYLYDYPTTLIILPFLVVTLELIFTKGILHYSLYVFFVYPFLYLVIWLVYSIFKMDVIGNVNTADYLARKWANPRYPRLFWSTITDNTTRYGFDWEFTDEEIAKLEQLALPHYTKNFYRSCMLPFRVANKPWCVRLTASYNIPGRRWGHSLIITNVPKTVLHKATA